MTGGRSMRGAVKELARAITPPVLWSAMHRLRRGRRIEPPVSLYSGLEELDRKLEKFVDFDAGFFIEVGGWDGITYSNSLYFERHRGWRGVLVEPSPTEFLKCRRNRPDALVFCHACVPFGYAERYVPMVYCASMTVTDVSDVALDRVAHVEEGRRFLQSDEETYEFGALARPLSTILDENDVTTAIDLLILDVEGYELPVLQGIDFTRHAPRFICVEAWDTAAIAAFLATHDYAFVERLTKHDYLFRKRE